MTQKDIFKWDVHSLLCPRSWQRSNPTGRIVARKWRPPGEMKEYWRGPPPSTGFWAPTRSANCEINLVPRFPSSPLSEDSILLDNRAGFFWPSYSSTPSRRNVWIGPELIMDGLLSSRKRWSLVTSRDSVRPLETKVAEYGDDLVNVFRTPASNEAWNSHNPSWSGGAFQLLELVSCDSPKMTVNAAAISTYWTIFWFLVLRSSLKREISSGSSKRISKSFIGLPTAQMLVPSKTYTELSNGSWILSKPILKNWKPPCCNPGSLWH